VVVFLQNVKQVILPKIVLIVLGRIVVAGMQLTETISEHP